MKKKFLDSSGSKELIFTKNGDSYAVTGIIKPLANLDIVIPSTYNGPPITSIGSYAFEEFASLDDCPFDWPFDHSLFSINIPDSVTFIGNDAFYGCSSLTSVTFENTEGWHASLSSDASSGTSVDVSDFSTAATYLTSTYNYYYWFRA